MGKNLKILHANFFVLAYMSCLGDTVDDTMD